MSSKSNKLIKAAPIRYGLISADHTGKPLVLASSNFSERHSYDDEDYDEDEDDGNVLTLHFHVVNSDYGIMPFDLDKLYKCLTSAKTAAPVDVAMTLTHRSVDDLQHKATILNNMRMCECTIQTTYRPLTKAQIDGLRQNEQLKKVVQDKLSTLSIGDLQKIVKALPDHFHQRV